MASGAASQRLIPGGAVLRTTAPGGHCVEGVELPQRGALGPGPAQRDLAPVSQSRLRFPVGLPCDSTLPSALNLCPRGASPPADARSGVAGSSQPGLEPHSPAESKWQPFWVSRGDVAPHKNK